MLGILAHLTKMSLLVSGHTYLPPSWIIIKIVTDIYQMFLMYQAQR